MTFTQNGKQHITLIHGHQPIDATLGAILTALVILSLCVAINTLFSRPLVWTADVATPVAGGTTLTITPTAPATPGNSASPADNN